MLPAQQRFRADNRAAGHTHLRLVLKPELLLLQSRPEVTDQFHFAVNLLAHGRFKPGKAILALFLDPVHCHGGVSDQFIAIPGIVGKQCVSQTSGDVHLPVPEFLGFRQLLTNGFGSFFHFGRGLQRRHHGEFIGSEPGYVAGFRTCVLDALADNGQELFDVPVFEQLTEISKIIQVDDQQGCES